MGTRVPATQTVEDIGANSTNGSGVCPAPPPVPAAQGIFNRQFYRYKDLQNENLFGPSMAFRVTRTPGWLRSVKIAGQPRYLPEAVHQTINRLRGGESPDSFEDCFGRGHGQPPKRIALPAAKSANNKSQAPKLPVRLPAIMLPPLTICEIRHRGKRRWRIIVRKGWEPILRCKEGTRKMFATKKAAEDYVGTAQVRIDKFSQGTGTFTDVEFGAFRMVLGMVGGDVQKLFTAVQEYVQKVEDTLGIKPRRAAVVARHLISERTKNGTIRPKTAAQYRYEARVFNATFGKTNIAEIKLNELQVWVRGLKLSPKTKKNLFRTISLFFDHAIKLGLRKDNPTVGIQLPRVDQATPERFSAAECEILLKTAVRTKSLFLLALVIGLFTGARPSEIGRLDRDNISLDEERINVPGAKCKTHKFRWMRISPLLRLWLEFIGPLKTAEIIPEQDLEVYEQWRQRLVKDSGIKRWPHDVLRHTHASFDYALKGDFDSVAANLGNSATISRENYIAPASRKEADEFLALTPAKILEALKSETPGPSPNATRL